jgi:hypothetical protein
VVQWSTARPRPVNGIPLAGTMKAVPRPQLSRLASKAGIQLERLSEGTVRFTLAGSGPPAAVTPDWFRRVTAPVYLVGREKSPTLADARRNAAGKRAKSRFPLLTQYRVVLLDGGSEVSAVTKAMLAAGWCVDNDAYLFPAEGGWLAYVGHHDELDVYVPRRPDGTVLVTPTRLIARPAVEC